MKTDWFWSIWVSAKAGLLPPLTWSGSCFFQLCLCCVCTREELKSSQISSSWTRAEQLGRIMLTQTVGHLSLRETPGHCPRYQKTFYSVAYSVNQATFLWNHINSKVWLIAFAFCESVCVCVCSQQIVAPKKMKMLSSGYLWTEFINTILWYVCVCVLNYVTMQSVWLISTYCMG